MKVFNIHTFFFELAFPAIIAVGLAFSLLLFLSKKGNRPANRVLALILAVIVLEMLRTLCIPGRFKPAMLLPALGPLIYFYIRCITRPEDKFRGRDLLHLITLPSTAGLAIYATDVLPGLFHLFIFIMVAIYVFTGFRLIRRFSRTLKFKGVDRYRLSLRWIYKVLTSFAILWLMWLPSVILGNPYPVYFLLASLAIGAAIQR